jgi:hypothetical protein
MIDVRQSRELQATILAIKAANADLRKILLRESRKVLRAVWAQELASRSRTPLEDRVLVRGASVRVGQALSVRAAYSVKKLPGGLVPAEDFAAVELGAKWQTRTVQATSRRGKPFSYKKVINKQFKPRRREGYVVFKSAKETGHRMTALWVQTIVKTYKDAVEGKMN